MINKATVTTASTTLKSGDEMQTNFVVTVDNSSGVVYLASGGSEARIGEGVRIEGGTAKSWHTFFGIRNEAIYAIAVTGTVNVSIHAGG